MIGASLVWLGAIGGLGYASIPSTSNGGTFTACVMNIGGTTRSIDTDAGQTCVATERKVSWGAAGLAR